MLERVRAFFLFVGFFILPFFVLGVDGVSAFDVFSDEFNYRDDLKWNYVLNGGTVDFVDGVMTLESTGPGFPVIYGKSSEVFLSDVDTTFEVKFKYNSFAPMGDGISVGYTGSSPYPFYQFSLWQDSTDGPTFMYNDFSISKYGQCDTFVPYLDLADRQYWSLNLPVSTWHVLQIKRVGVVYEVLLDNEILHTTGEGQCLPPNIILGNPLRGGSAGWNSLSIDYLRIVSVGDTEVNNKIIIVPGLGASWNSQAIVYNEDVGVDQWGMTPFVKTYDGLISAFEAKGLVQGDDFYVWNYDWRQPVETIVDNFDNFVDEVVESEEEVDVVGHSLGGLTARVWAQENLDKAGKVVTLGSPHAGAVGAYDAWSGGRLSDKFGVRSIALNVLLQLQKEGGQTKIETVRNYVPVLKDLLPTFDFAKMGRRILPVADLESQNTYLADKNLTVAPVFDSLTAMVATGEQTKEWVKLKPRSIFDEVLGIWPDGRATGYSFGAGDGTVLKKSAKFEEDDFVEVSSNHGQMVNDLVEEVFEELSLGEVTEALGEVEDLSSSTVFFVGSPVDMNLVCNGDLYEDDEGFVVFDGQNYNQCEVNLVAMADGVYHLVTGKLGDEDSWHYFEGEVEMGENIILSIDPRDGSLVLDEATGDFLYGLIKRDLELLVEQNGENENLTKALAAVEDEKLEDLITAVFSFRKETQESRISERILANLETLLMIENMEVGRSQARRYYLKAMRAKSMIDRKARLLKRRGWRPEIFGANSYELMTQKSEMLRADWRATDYAVVMARARLVLELSEEVL